MQRNIAGLVILALTLTAGWAWAAEDYGYGGFFPPGGEIAGWQQRFVRKAFPPGRMRGQAQDMMVAAYKKTSSTLVARSLNLAVARFVDASAARAYFAAESARVLRTNRNAEKTSVSGVAAIIYHGTAPKIFGRVRLVFAQGRYVGMVEAFFTPGQQDRAWVKLCGAALQKRMLAPARPAAPPAKAQPPTPPPGQGTLEAMDPGPGDLPGWKRQSHKKKLRFPFNQAQGGVRAKAAIYSWWFSTKSTPHGMSRLSLDVVELPDVAGARRFLDARIKHWQKCNWKAWPGAVKHGTQSDTVSLYGDPKASHVRNYVRVGRFLAVAFVEIPQGVNSRATNQAVTQALLKHMLAAQGTAAAKPPTPTPTPTPQPTPPPAVPLPGQNLLPTEADLPQWRQTQVKQPALKKIKGITPTAGIEGIYRWKAGGNLPALVIKVWTLSDAKQAATYFEEYRWQWAKRPGQARKLKLSGQPGFIHVLLSEPRTISIGFTAGRYVALLIAISHQPPLGERYTTNLALAVLKRLLGSQAAAPAPQPKPTPAVGPKLGLVVHGALQALAQGQGTALPVSVKNTGSAVAKGVELRIWTPTPNRLGFSQSAKVRPRAFLVKAVGDLAPGQSASAGQVMVHALACSGSALSVVTVYPGGQSHKLTWHLRPGQAQAGGGLEVVARAGELSLANGEEAPLPLVIRNSSTQTIKRVRLYASSNRAAQVGLLASAGQMAEPWLERYVDLAPGQEIDLSPWRVRARVDQGQAMITLTATPGSAGSAQARSAQVTVRVAPRPRAPTPDEQKLHALFGPSARLIGVWPTKGASFIFGGVIQKLPEQVYVFVSPRVTYHGDQAEWRKLKVAEEAALAKLVDKVTGTVKKGLIKTMGGQVAGELAKFKSTVAKITDPRATQEDIVMAVATYQVPSSAKLYYQLLRYADRLGALLTLEKGMARAAAAYEARAGVLMRSGQAAVRGLLISGSDGRTYFTPFAPN